MHILFNEKENEWIDKNPFSWTIKKDCPEHIKKTLVKKIELLKGVSSDAKRV